MDVHFSEYFCRNQQLQLRENLIVIYEQQEANQSAHPRILISAFVIRDLECKVSELTACEFPAF